MRRQANGVAVSHDVLMGLSLDLKNPIKIPRPFAFPCLPTYLLTRFS
jgi:hypothetical protein